MEDIRWIQRLANFRKALANLDSALEKSSFSNLELQGLIKGFEMCYELAWKTLQDLLRERGFEDISGPKPVLRQAFKEGLVSNGDRWNEIHEARNLASHTYDLERARGLEVKIREDFAPAFRVLRDTLEGLVR